MGRIRSIKPESPQSENLGRVSRDARLLFFMLFTIADDEGRGRGNSRMLASLLFPYDDDAPQLIPQWLMELERENAVTVYQHDGNIYFQVVKWLEHQKIDKPTKSKLPCPPDRAKPRRALAKPREPSPDALDASRSLLGRDGKGEEGSGEEGINNATPQAALVVMPQKPLRPELPVWVPADAWAGFVEMRRKKRAPLTDRAIRGLINKLEKLRDAGHDPGAVLDQSTLNAWQDVFELRAGTRDKVPRAERLGFVDAPLKPEEYPEFGYENRE